MSYKYNSTPAPAARVLAATQHTRGRELFKAPAVAAGKAEQSLRTKEDRSGWTPTEGAGEEWDSDSGPRRSREIRDRSCRLRRAGGGGRDGGGVHGDPNPATCAHGLWLPSSCRPTAAAPCVTRAFRAEYRLSLAQSQPDAGETEQGLGSGGGKETSQRRGGAGWIESPGYGTH
jgi:hypothetical protein